MIKKYHVWTYQNQSAKKKYYCTECRGWTDNATVGKAAKKTCPGKNYKE